MQSSLQALSSDWIGCICCFIHFSTDISLYVDFYIAIVSHLIAYNKHLELGLIYFRTDKWTNILEKVFPDLVGQEIKYIILETLK